MNSEAVPSPWRTNLTLVLGVIFTLVVALLMAQLDRLQTRLQPTAQAVVQITAAATHTIPAISLPADARQTPTPTFTRLPAGTPEETAVSARPQCGQVPNNWVSYFVQRGDTLFSLSLHSGATIEQITQVNCLDMNQLITGMQIYLPNTPPQRAPCGPPSWWTRYTVQPGDTMYSLARSRSTTVYEIRNANCFYGDRLLAGKQIYLPPLPSTATWTPLPPTAPPPPPPTQTPPPANTATATATPSHTPPPNPSPTVTLEPATATATTPAMATSTPTPTATPTEINTPIPTATTTPTPINTLPPTPTATPLPPTETSTPVPIPTSTPTDTPTP